MLYNFLFWVYLTASSYKEGDWTSKKINDLVLVTQLLTDRRHPSPRFSDAKFSDLSINSAVTYKTLHWCNNVLLSFSLGLCLPESWSRAVLLIGSTNQRPIFVKPSELPLSVYSEFPISMQTLTNDNNDNDVTEHILHMIYVTYILGCILLRIRKTYNVQICVLYSICNISSLYTVLVYHICCAQCNSNLI